MGVEACLSLAFLPAAALLVLGVFAPLTLGHLYAVKASSCLFSSLALAVFLKKRRPCPHSVSHWIPPVDPTALLLLLALTAADENAGIGGQV